MNERLIPRLIFTDDLAHVIAGIVLASRAAGVRSPEYNAGFEAACAAIATAHGIPLRMVTPAPEPRLPDGRGGA